MSARASSSADREVLITRIINAPRDLVFEAWIDSKHADKWMGPAGYETVTQSMDVRPGGMWRFTMTGPQGVFPNRVTYVEVVPPIPYAGAIWIGGYWGWGSGGYRWVPGRWDHPHPGYSWRPHVWVQQGGQWHSRGGAWVRG